MRRLLIVANETVAGRELLDAIEQRARDGALDITVLCPINEPRGSYVVDPDAVRGAAAERLERTLRELHDNGIEARGSVVDAGPLDAVRDYLAHETADEVIVSTHPRPTSRWLRRDVIEQLRRLFRDVPVEHVVVDQSRSEVIG